jgi:hypothetical protein
MTDLVKENYWSMYLLVFFGMMLVDFAYAEYTKAAADRKYFWSSNWAAILVVFNQLVIASCVNDIWLIIPVFAGAWLGTYISIKWMK